MPGPRETFADASARAIALLRAVRAGDDCAVRLAAELAELVLTVSGARLALEVLERGPFTITRAIRLAEHVLSTIEAGEMREERSS